MTDHKPDATTDYQPVDCAAYDRFESAIVLRVCLRLSWRDERGAGHIDRIRPFDLETRKGEEFLLFEDSVGTCKRVRLDRIRDVAEL